MNDTRGKYARDARTIADGEDSNVVAGAGLGAAFGGLVGLLAGLGALVIPGIGPIVAAGPLASTLAGATVGAATGGLVGALSEIGVPEEEARHYAEAVRRGGTVIAVRAVDEHMVDRARVIMDRHGALNLRQRVVRWQQSDRADSDAPAQPRTISSSGDLDPLLNMDDGRVILKRKQPETQSSTAGAPLGEAHVGDSSITKINSRYSPKGELHQKYLASGVKVSMRLWENEQPGEWKAQTQREYETVGYVIKGRAELHIAGQMVSLEPGDCWVVPKESIHQYRILEPFTAVEATCPPAEVHGRDEA